MQSRGYGEYEEMDSAVLPNLYVAYRTSLSEGTEVFHNSLRRRYESGDRRVREAMRQWARMAEEGRAALLAGDTRRFGQLIDDNFDLRAEVTELSPQNRTMVEAARSLGATAKFAGSGGAIMGTYRDEEHFETLREGLAKQGIRTIRPVI